MEKISVIATDDIDESGMAPLANHPRVDFIREIRPEPARLIEILRLAQAWIVRSETKITADWIAKAPHLRLIGRAGTGLDNIDAAAAAAGGIKVVNTPASNAIAACEHAFGLMLALARHIPQAHSDVRSGEWRKNRWMGTEVFGKTLGIIGLGRIGREMARRAAVFGMTVMAFDPNLKAEDAARVGAALTTLDALLEKSDFITLHAPALPQTKHIINREAFALMKSGARIINCSRGDLLDEDALIHALESGRLAGAALDVFSKEPLVNESPLRRMSNVILTPHLGASTQEAQKKAADGIARLALDFFGLN
ncbi:MAG: hydroxyacid dehydrogenase [Elusimicrobiota bacterium]